ncbi:MAG: DEAD/DEAH box helicase [Candidatus Taylorbacteria bacterium]|nr:DEAD/DEAH box helicase [Candidatus Taylorbacteria bacterium]
MHSSSQSGSHSSGGSFSPRPRRSFVRGSSTPSSSPARSGSFGTRSSTPGHSRGGFGASRPSGSYSGSARPASHSGGYRGHSSHSSSSRGGFGGGSRGGSRGGGKRFSGAYIDPTRFINKINTAASVVEEIPEYVPVHKFADFTIADALKRNIATKGYITPTPIQDTSIPHIIVGKDIVGIANTGTGKTAAFLIPLINKIMSDYHHRVLIIVPTRELALQIEEEFRGFSRGLGIHAVTCIGGAHLGMQVDKLRRSHNFVIGTPGRLKDLVERKTLDLSKYGTIVLDEADRMLDMGFIHDMKYVMSRMPTPRHTLFFSATMSPEITALIGEFLKDPVKVSVKTRDTSANVDQDIVRISDPAQKFSHLVKILKDPEWNKVLVFGRTKHGVERISRQLTAEGIKAESIHGDKSLGQRKRALESFKAGSVQVLCATDVAARGLDIRNVTHVVNYDVPGTYEDYIHRIGRTGRAGQMGKALTFVEGR